MNPRRAGFSLIEALVALTIAAMVLGAVFQLQVQMARDQARAAEVMEQVRVQENALALLRNLNPMAQPQGVLTLPGGGNVRWSSAPKVPPRTNAGFPAGDGLFEVQLYTVTVEMERPAGAPPPPLTFDRLGWRRLTVESQ